jgi:hypothetical protein
VTADVKPHRKGTDIKNRTQTQSAKDGAKRGSWIRNRSLSAQEYFPYATLGAFLGGLVFGVALIVDLFAVKLFS